MLSNFISWRIHQKNTDCVPISSREKIDTWIKIAQIGIGKWINQKEGRRFTKNISKERKEEIFLEKKLASTEISL